MIIFIVFRTTRSSHIDGNGQGPADEGALRTLVNEINAKLTSREVEQRLSFVQFEWDQPLGEFLVLCNTFAAVGLVS